MLIIELIIRKSRRSPNLAKLVIKWIKSGIGYQQDQRRTIRALGLKRLHHTVAHEDTPTIRGMIHKVRHLVNVESEVLPEDSVKLEKDGK